MTRSLALLAGLVAAASVHAQALDGRLKKIADAKSIAIAYRPDAMPFSFEERGQVGGFTVDLCKRVVAAIERQLKVEGLNVNWVPVTSQSRFEAVASGRADLECGSSTITLSRMKQVDFSSITFVETTGLLVKGSSGVRSLASLAGKKIAVITGTTNERAVANHIKRHSLGITLVPVASRDEAMAAIDADKVDAFASDRMLLAGAMVNAKDPRAYTILGENLSFEPYGIALPRGDANLRLAVNSALAQLYTSGEIVEIFRRWFGQFGAPPPIMEAVYILGAIPE